MKTFAFIFILGGIIGIALNVTGGAIMSFAMVFLVAYGNRVFAAQERAYNESPVSARVQPTTLELLDSYGSESSESRFHVQPFKD